MEIEMGITESNAKWKVLEEYDVSSLAQTEVKTPTNAI